MVFSSLLFIFIYLVVTLALYYAVPNRVYRNVILCVLSLIFYGWGEPSFVLLMIFSIAFNWLAGLSENIETTKNAARLYSLLPLC